MDMACRPRSVVSLSHHVVHTVICLWYPFLKRINRYKPDLLLHVTERFTIRTLGQSAIYAALSFRQGQ